MNQNETRTLWISVGAALFAAFLIYSYIQEKSKKLADEFGAKTNVLVATRDINEMETIDNTMVQMLEVPNAYKQPLVITDPELAIGKVALAPIKEKEQVLESKVLEPGPVTGLSLQVQPSKRAVTIPIDDMRGVAKLIKPGDRIDLVAALDVGKGASQKREVKTIMQDVIILATGLRINNELPRLFEKVGRDDFIRNLRDDTTFSTITVEASPKQAQDLIYILSTSPGSLFMTLRHPSDREKNRLPTSTVETVLNKVAKPVIRKQLRTPQSTRPAPKKKPKRKKRSGPFIDI